jgi:hypothetical protein
MASVGSEGGAEGEEGGEDAEGRWRRRFIGRRWSGDCELLRPASGREQSMVEQTGTGPRNWTRRNEAESVMAMSEDEKVLDFSAFHVRKGSCYIRRIKKRMRAHSVPY